MSWKNLRFVFPASLCLRLCAVGTEMTLANGCGRSVGGKQGGRCSCLPTRHVFSILTFAGLTMFCVMRVNLSIAIVAMVDPKLTTADTVSDDVECYELLPKPSNQTDATQQTVSNATRKTFDWDIKTQSAILGAFSYGYTATQLLGGLLAQRFGGKWTFGIGILAASVFTLLTPLAAEFGATTLIIIRIFQGLSQCILFPSINILIAQWVPMKERSLTLCFIYNGMWCGFAAGMLLSGVLASSEIFGGWPSVFYVFGVLGCLLFVVWSVLIFETPALHPRISDAELRLIYEDQFDLGGKTSGVPWRAIMTSVPVWALAIAIFGYNWEVYVISSEMPTYLANILHFDIKTNGVLCAMPYVLQALSGLFAGYVADRLIENKKGSVTFIRKVMNSIAAFGSAVCILLIIFAGCEPVYSVGLIYIGMFINGFSMPGCDVAAVEMSPRFIGTMTGIVYTLSCTAGFLTTFAVGELTSSGQTTDNWNWVFIITTIICVFCGVVFDVFGSSEEQPWNNSNSEEKHVNEGSEVCCQQK